MSFAEAICAKCEHKNSVTVCLNCDSDKLTVSITEESKKVDKVVCKNCTHSFNKIKCTFCKADIYLKTAKIPKPSSCLESFLTIKQTPQAEAESNILIWLAIIVIGVIVYLFN